MQKRYIFREIKKEEIPQFFSLIRQRIAWMEQQGIRQWNDTGYEEEYPQAYYEAHRQKGQLFVLEDPDTGEIVSGGVLKEEDDRWPDEASAVYLHNFASSITERGAGSIFLQYAEAYAASKGKGYFRLDSPEGNQILERYYGSRGYTAVGTCMDGLYKGILRQKAMPLTAEEKGVAR